MVRHTHKLDEDQAAELVVSSERVADAFDAVTAAADRVGEHAADVARRVDALRKTLQLLIGVVLGVAVAEIVFKLGQRR